jgi:hypothetical protein
MSCMGRLLLSGVKTKTGFLYFAVNSVEGKLQAEAAPVTNFEFN